MPNSYMVDEVWQNVAVDTRLKNSAAGQYFIHQAGPGQNGPELQMPYAFSPTVAHFCSEIDRECRFASWGMVNPTPTKYRTKALFMTRYRDCGNGILEITALVYNFDNKDAADLDDYPIDHTISTNFNYMSFPWFGVNDHVYRDVLLRANYDDQAETDWITQWPNPEFGSAMINLRDFGGFTTMAEHRHHDTFVFPGYDAAPDTKPDFTLGLMNGGLACQAHKSNSVRYGSVHVRCRLAVSSSYWGRCPSCELTFTNSITSNTIDVSNVGQYYDNGYIIFGPSMGEDNGIILGNAYYNLTFANEVAAHVNSILTPGSEILISWKTPGLDDDDNQCLVLIHGDGRKGVTSGTDLFQHGSSRSLKRKYMVMNEIHRRTVLAGSSFGRRTYLLTGKGIESTKIEADKLVGSVVEDLIGIGEYPSTSIHVYVDEGNFFGVTLGDTSSLSGPCSGTAFCSGYSTPTADNGILFTFPHFQISCGDQTYFGSDVYHFALSNEKEEQIPYVCDESDYSVRPELQLIGFFAEGDCSEIVDKTYDEDYCGSSPDSPPTSQLSQSPSFTPSNVPSEVACVCAYLCLDMQSYFAQSDEFHAVRCCSDTANADWVKNDGCAIWSESRLSGEKCFDSETFYNAEQICEANGGRLCTIDEVVNRCTRLSGCGFDSTHIWTSFIKQK